MIFDLKWEPLLWSSVLFTSDSYNIVNRIYVYFQGKLSQARYHYETALRLQPTHELLIENLSKLNYDEMYPSDTNTELHHSYQNHDAVKKSQNSHEEEVHSVKGGVSDTYDVSVGHSDGFEKCENCARKEHRTTYTNNPIADANFANMTDTQTVGFEETRINNTSAVHRDIDSAIGTNKNSVGLSSNLDGLSCSVTGGFVIYQNTTSICGSKTDIRGNGTI